MKKTVLLLRSFHFSFRPAEKIEDRVVGSWKLTSSYKQQLFDREHFNRGYESGIFTFNENGNAIYISSTDTLTGYCSADKYTVTTGSKTRLLRQLRMELVNFLRNRYLFREFDDLNFRNTCKTIRAEEYGLSYNRI